MAQVRLLTSASAMTCHSASQPETKSSSMVTDTARFTPAAAIRSRRRSIRSATTPMNGAAIYPAILLAATIPTIKGESVSSSVSQPITTTSAHRPVEEKRVSIQSRRNPRWRRAVSWCIRLMQRRPRKGMRDKG